MNTWPAPNPWRRWTDPRLPDAILVGGPLDGQLISTFAHVVEIPGVDGRYVAVDYTHRRFVYESTLPT